MSESIVPFAITSQRLASPFAGVLAIVLFSMCADRAIAKQCGSLAAVKEKIEVLRVQPASESRAGESVRYVIAGKNFLPLECDDIVQSSATGSAKLILGDDKITLAPESRIEIARHSGSDIKPKVDLLNLTYGKMRGLIKARPPGKTGERAQGTKGAFRVRTFSAVVGVRGTDLFASYDPNSGMTEQAVLEGKVEVTQVGTQQKVMVEAGQQVSIATTPAAIAAAQKRTSTPGDESDDAATGPVAPSAVPVPAPTVGNVPAPEPLKVVPIRESVKRDMRVTSAIAKDDPQFTSPSAVSVLGKAETWTLERESIPANLKDLKNEF